MTHVARTKLSILVTILCAVFTQSSTGAVVNRSGSIGPANERFARWVWRGDAPLHGGVRHAVGKSPGPRYGKAFHGIEVVGVIGIQQPLATSGVSANLLQSTPIDPVWNVDASGFWDVATNWDMGWVPGSVGHVGEDVVIDRAAGTFTVTVRSPNNFTINNLSMPGDEILAITGGSLTVDGTFANNANTNISAGTLTLNGVSSMGSLTMSGGVLGGTGNVTITGPSTWTAGTLTGAGTIQFDSTLAISGATGKSITGGRNVNAGNTTWSGNTGSNNNTISIASTSAFNNTGTFADANTFNSTISGGTFNNNGTFNKQSNTTTTVSTVFNNTGTVNVNAGTMLMQSGGTSTGTFDLAAGALMEFRNGAHTLNNVTINGAGIFQISSDGVGADALVTVNGGTLNSAFLLSGSTMNGTDQVFQGPATWTGGTINGSALQSTTFAGTLTISGANGKVLSGGRSLNAGNTTWSGNTGDNNNAISLGGSGTFNNTGSFTDANTFNSSIASGTFNNNGTFNKQSNTTTSIGTVFNSTGTVNVNAGTMLMNGGGTDSGTFNIANGAKLEFRNGSHTLNNVTISGAGTFEISTDNVGADAIVTLNGGTLTSAFVLSGSILTGTSHTFQGVATWSGGTITGAATASTTFANALTISGPNSKTLSGGRSVNAGDTTWTGNTANGNNSINISGASVFNSSGTFTDANTFDSAINVGNGGGTFVNNGTFNKQSNTTTAVGTQFSNAGTVNVNAGLMLMNGGGTSNAGVFNIANGAKLEFRNGNYTLNNVTTSGAGILQISTDSVGADAVVAVNGGTHTTPFILSGSTLTGTDNTFQGPVTWSGGTISGAASTTFTNNVAITGANPKTVFGGRVVNLEGITTWSGNTAANNNAIQFWNGGTINNFGTFNDSNAFNSFIEHVVGGPHNFNNLGTYNKTANTTTTVDFGVVFNNSGTVNLNAGVMDFVSGTQGPTGTIQVASGATFQHEAASTVGNMITAGTLALSTRNLTVFIDYDNANFGVGNSFNRRANVTGSGLILAASNTAQAVTGTGVTNGGTTTPTLTIGNVHVGANTFNYQIANTGTTGPAIRGALQTVNGGNITDARLSGSGVTASNFGPVATGANTGNLGVTFTAASAGVLAPLSGQVVHITNNFDNVADQNLSIVLGAGAAAYNLAAGNATPSPITIGNQRVGGSGSQVLNVANTAPSGSFTEGLNASFGSNTGNATNNGGTINLLAGQGSNSAAMSVGVNTGTAGAKSGSVTLNYVSDGTGTSGLGLTNVGSQVINISGNVYRLAQGAATPTPVSFGNVHVGDAASQVLTVSNTAANDGFSESLNASFGANSGAATNNAGSLSLLAAGGSNASAMSVGLNTSTAGAKSGSVTLNYASDGSGTSGLSAIAAGSQSIDVSGNVYRLASANTLGAVSFGNVHVGDTVQQALNISNTAAADGFSESLNASFGASSDGRITTSGSINQLAAGSSNASSMIVGLDTSAAGTVNGTQTINFASDGSGTSGLGITALASQTIGVSGDITTSGNVFRLASASPAAPNPVNFGNVRVGTATDQALSISNTAANDGFSESLNASISSNGAPVTASGAFNLLAAQSTDNSSLHVGIDTSSAGAKSGSATIALVSDGTGTSGLGTTNLSSQTVSVSGNVYRLAQASAHSPEPVVLANQRVGGTATQALSLTNTAANDGFSERLNASFSGTSGSATASGSFNLLGAGATDNSSLNVGVDTSTAGAKSGTATIALQSDGAGTSGLAAIGAGTQTVNVSGNVYRLAQGAATPTPVSFGNVHVGDAASQVLTVSNTAANDGFSESLNASFGANSGAATNNAGSLSLLAAGGSNASAMSVGLNTSTAGAKSGSVTLNYASDGSGTSGLSAIAAGSQSIDVSGNVYRLASANTLGAVSFGNVHVGDTVQQALNISNTAAADGFSESLNASFGASSDGRITTSGSINQLAAGSSNASSMIVGLDTSAAGTVNGTQTINFASDGSGTSGLGITALASQTIGVSGDITTSGNVFRLASASPAAPNPVNFGNVRVGTATDQALSISNTAANDGFSESLNASISSNGAPVTASGAFNLLAAQSTDNSSLHVGIDTSSAGAKSGSATIALVSDGTGTSGLGTTNLSSQTVSVSGNVYRLASPTLNTPAVTLAARVGDAAPTGNISVTNTSPDAYTEGLKAGFGTTSAGFNATGSIGNLAAGGTDASSLNVALASTATSQNLNGTAQVNFESTGAGTTGATDISVGSTLVNLVGKVYQQAAALVNTAAVNFGIVHVGDSVTAQNVSVSNAAPSAALNDVLLGSISATGPFTADGTLGAGLGAGTTDASSLNVGLDTSTAGSFNGQATVGTQSHNADMADLALTDELLSLSATVNNYAVADLNKTGGAGNFSGSGNIFILDFGNLAQGTGAVDALLEALNNVAGPSDLLDGSFDLSGSTHFLLTGFNDFANLGAGDAATGLDIGFDPTLLGLVSDTITLHAFGHNASGYIGDTQDLTLILKANVVAASVPEPGSLALVGIALLALLTVRRRSGVPQRF